MANIPDEVLDEMLEAGAEIAIHEIQEKARAYGIYKTHQTVNSIVKRKPRHYSHKTVLKIAFRGSRMRGNSKTTNEEIAFINEFGKKNQPARPFVRDAIEKNSEYIAGAEEYVYDNWLNSKNL